MYLAQHHDYNHDASGVSTSDGVKLPSWDVRLVDDATCIHVMETVNVAIYGCCVLAGRVHDR